MASVEGRPQIDLKIVMVINEAEARALDALAGYGTDKFLEVFYEKLGQAYMKPHAAGLASLFEAIRTQLPCYLSRMDRAEKVFQGLMEAVPRERPEPPASAPVSTVAPVRANQRKKPDGQGKS